MSLEPQFRHQKFTCPHCLVVSQHAWFDRESAAASANTILDNFWLQDRLTVPYHSQEDFEKFKQRIERANHIDMPKYIPDNFAVASCSACYEVTLWISGGLVYPRRRLVAPPNADMDEVIRDLYLEAEKIVTDSPKGAAALLRLALQLLLKQLGLPGENINADIQKLVSDGLSTKIQKALDVLRVVGNNAVHPGRIDFSDKSDLALKLFHVLNYIADEMITKPKELEMLYSQVVPESVQSHIAKRDKK
ncbi:DUF4145 domain-containing protein [Allohahella sp. A8]|uniref:DUF4145 domain-containing protein n=1 Tax=Allohahella sp. A8 TaxID=3141461 RepID=UPI003A803D57